MQVRLAAAEIGRARVCVKEKVKQVPLALALERRR